MMAAAACLFSESDERGNVLLRRRRRVDFLDGDDDDDDFFLPFLALNVGKSSDASLLLLLARKLFFRLNEKQWHSFFFP